MIGGWNQQQQMQVQPQQYSFAGSSRGGGGMYYRGQNGLQMMPEDQAGYQFPMYGQQQPMQMRRPPQTFGGPRTSYSF